MGFFKKKADPISERAKALNDQIAALEAEIQRLSTERVPEEPERAAPPPPASRTSRQDARPPSAQPKLRSTTLPHSHSAAAAHAQSEAAPEPRPVEEPVLEDLNPFRHTSDAMPAAPSKPSLGLRGPESVSVWDRVKNNFRGPATSNPKLVNYLAAGSIQGLRPLRYEKRVARNRFLLFAVALALMLWGLLAVILKR